MMDAGEGEHHQIQLELKSAQSDEFESFRHHELGSSQGLALATPRAHGVQSCQSHVLENSQDHDLEISHDHALEGCRPQARNI